MNTRLRSLQVPGTYMDALNPQTKLGKAVKGAVKELEQLNSMVRRAARNDEGPGSAEMHLDGCLASTLLLQLLQPREHMLAGPPPEQWWWHACMHAHAC